MDKVKFKNILGALPLTAEIYWQLRQRGRPQRKKYSLQKTAQLIPLWKEQAERYHLVNRHLPNRKRVLLFTTLRLWVEHGTLLSIALAGFGHQVTFSFLPYIFWHKPINRFDLRKQNAYFKNVLQKTQPLVSTQSLVDLPNKSSKEHQSLQLPAELRQSIYEVTLRDTQYTLQIEDIDIENPESPSGQLYNLRLERNLYTANTFFNWFNSMSGMQKPDVVIVPNGSILEMGALYQASRFAQIPVVTYEFGEQRGRIWLAKNDEVMLQNTDALWRERKELNLDEEKWGQMRDLYSARQNADLWKNFYKRWQTTPNQGGENTRAQLGLDSRPIVLLAANVLADSLTLGRQIFSKNMTEWLQKTVEFFANHPEAQLIVRMHPGERYTKGPSVSEVVHKALGHIPENIHLVHASDSINTYDLIDIADVGLAYTTTVGMEMAMSGIPVIVTGKTHYRNKGFTIDPNSWDSYYEKLNATLESPNEFGLSRKQVELAWKYAYLFFFEYPCPFPWHLKHFWKELKTWPVERVLSQEGMQAFGMTFDILTGGDRDWSLPCTNPSSLDKSIVPEENIHYGRKG